MSRAINIRTKNDGFPLLLSFLLRFLFPEILLGRCREVLRARHTRALAVLG